jgi:hypothetical protein
MFVHLPRPADKFALLLAMVAKLLALASGVCGEDNPDALPHHEVRRPPPRRARGPRSPRQLPQQPDTAAEEPAAEPPRHQQRHLRMVRTLTLQNKPFWWGADAAAGRAAGQVHRRPAGERPGGLPRAGAARHPPGPVRPTLNPDCEDVCPGSRVAVDSGARERRMQGDGREPAAVGPGQAGRTGAPAALTLAPCTHAAPVTLRMPRRARRLGCADGRLLRGRTRAATWSAPEALKLRDEGGFSMCACAGGARPGARAGDGEPAG